jgi:hypothetical protein
VVDGEERIKSTTTHSVVPEYGPNGTTTGNYSSHYYTDTYTYDDDGTLEDTERETIFTVGPQRQAPDASDALARQLDDQIGEPPGYSTTYEHTAGRMEERGGTIGEHGEIPYDDATDRGVLYDGGGPKQLTDPEHLDQARERGEIPDYPAPGPAQ